MNFLKHFLAQGRIDRETMEKMESLPPGELGDFLAQKLHLDLEELEKGFLDSFRQKDILEALEKLNILSPQTIDRLRAESTGQPMLPRLVADGMINDEQAARALALSLNLEYLSLEDFKIDDELFNSVDIRLMKEKIFIPLAREGNVLRIVMADPGQVDDIEYIEYRVGTSIYPCVAPRPAILKLINLMIETSLDSRTLFADAAESRVVLVPDDEGGAATKKGSIEFQAPVISLVDSIILKAVRKGASDIHFDAFEKSLKVKYRIDGILHEIIASVESPMKEAVVARIKVMANLDIAEKRVPQDGRFKLKIDERPIDFRVSILPSIHGETAVLRILDKSLLGLNLEKLGLEGEDLARFQRNVNKPYGMILVAGPTGSGKTTTLYSAIKYVYTPQAKIVTIEDPVEFQFPDITQVQVNEKKGLTFATGLRSIVRQDPNKIMVGEIRDTETAEIAINAVLTGHLVFSTIHANNVIDTISRLVNMKLDVYEFTSSMNLIMSQRLVRKICLSCKADDDTITPEDRTLIRDFQAHQKIPFYIGKGCRYCQGTGFKGRLGIFEVLAMTSEVRALILARSSPLDLLALARGQGMKTLREAAWSLVERGLTCFREINRVTFEDE